MSGEKLTVAVAHGDGIGPEIMDVTLKILEKAQAPLDFHPVEIGEQVYLKGHPTGIEDKTWEVIRSSKAFLKAPITTPQGGGFKSLNVTIRTTMGLYANVRPCVSYHPFIQTKHPNMDVVIVRENEEDLYSGIEYQQTPQCSQSLKLISRPGCEKIVRYAFEFAKAYGRKKVTCFTKDNIMKISDGLFHKVFEEIATKYPDIENEHWIVDIGAAKLADSPEVFDVVVMPNLYGDILSDVAAQISGSVGLAGSANIGIHGAMFEAIHGSAPRRAGQNVANPSGLLHGAIQMLLYLQMPKIASMVHNAWLKTIEDGVHTYDIFTENVSKQKVGTKEFGDAIIDRLGSHPTKLKTVDYSQHTTNCIETFEYSSNAEDREFVGIDIYLYDPVNAQTFIDRMRAISLDKYELTLITNRGARIYPNGHPETFCIDHWRCRYMPKDREDRFTQEDSLKILSKLAEAGVDIIKTEHLYNFAGCPAYSHAKG